MAVHDELRREAIPEILAFLDFKVSSTDAEFLERYVRWRIEHPIVK